MTKLELLNKYLDQATYNVMCYSKNLLMSSPKAGFENEWAEAQAEVSLLRQMIEEEA